MKADTLFCITAEASCCTGEFFVREDSFDTVTLEMKLYEPVWAWSEWLFAYFKVVADILFVDPRQTRFAECMDPRKNISRKAGRDEVMAKSWSCHWDDWNKMLEFSSIILI